MNTQQAISVIKDYIFESEKVRGYENWLILMYSLH